MRVLVACEFSGIVREAFRARGHDAWSCDLLPTEIQHPQFAPYFHHHQCDVIELFFGRVAHSMRLEGQGLEWDLLIAHPPCTYLCNSGVRWLYGGKGTKIDPERWILMEEGAEFFKRLLNAPIARIAVENPIMHRYARKIVGRGHDQIIHPKWFGHPETKATCLWLNNLPPLRSTMMIEGPLKPRVHHASPGPDRWKERSRTLTGIAEAMAEQWGSLT